MCQYKYKYKPKCKCIYKDRPWSCLVVSMCASHLYCFCKWCTRTSTNENPWQWQHFQRSFSNKEIGIVWFGYHWYEYMSGVYFNHHHQNQKHSSVCWREYKYKSGWSTRTSTNENPWQDCQGFYCFTNRNGIQVFQKTVSIWLENKLKKSFNLFPTSPLLEHFLFKRFHQV